VNEQTVLGVVHLLMVREHNRIASELAKINPHWNDETIFHVMLTHNFHLFYQKIIFTSFLLC
jgi:hypothetical protein